MFINIDNLKINYEVSGSGRDLILLHGWGGQINSFAPVHKHFGKSFRTFSIDLPGFGSSDAPPEPWGVEQYSNIVCKFLDIMKIENPILMGHSNGGRISIHIASNRKVHKVILVDSAGIKPKRGPEYYIKVYTYKTLKNILKLPVLREHSEEILNKYRKKVGSADYKNASGVMQRTLVKLVNEDLKNLMPLISAPTLLIWGENDTATPVSDAKIMEKLIPDAGLVILKNCGHYSYLEKLNEFLIITSNFLKNDMEDKSV